MALSGVVRLARFKVKDPLRGQGGYAGLPITANAAWVALFVFVTLTVSPDGALLSEGPVALTFLAGILIFIVLQVTNLRYPKPTKYAFLFLPSMVLVILFCTLHPRYARVIAYVILALGLAYVFIGPLFVKGMVKYKERHERHVVRQVDRP